MDDVYAIIMAGGSGERFWPLSTPDRPKQFLCLGGEKSLLRRTVDRIQPVIPIDRQLVVAGEQHASRIREELPDLLQENIICEPIGRNTAACIGLAFLFLARRNPNAVAVVFPADHHIVEGPAFLSSVVKAVRLAREGDLTVVIGIQPDRPEAGYGYMQIGQEIEPDVYSILKFHEKPDEETARRYVGAGNYFWNTGIFVWQTRTIEQLMQRFLPEHRSKLDEIRAAMETPGYQEVLAKVYPTIEKISVDYGIVEKAENIKMIHGRFGWDDLGSWTALDRIFVKNEEDNVVIGHHVGLNTANCIIFGQKGKIVATIGLRDLIIAETEHGLLICPKEDSQEIRNLLGTMSPPATEEQ